MKDFTLPALGSDMDGARLLEWRVKPGDRVARGQVVAVVDTSKAAVDVESWQEGVVFELLAQPGETLPVGAVMATLLEPGESAQTAKHTERKPAPAVIAAAAPATTPAPVLVAARRRISPAARKLAQEHGLDLDTLPGTGPDGAVTLQDVQHAADTTGAQPPAGDRHAAMRQAIAAAMSRSKREIPHYYLSETIPLQRAQAWLASTNANRDIGSRLLMAVLQLKAVAMALAKYPDLNGFYLDGKHQPGAAIHIGVAISLRQGGLIAPAIHDVGKKTLDQLMHDLGDLVKRARAGSLRSSEMSDPTITVTNLGDQGVETVYGVIFPPQRALLGFGRVHERAWASDGALRALPVVCASLAADHRVSDGHYGALFLAAVRDWLQRPEQL
jgi:pyruvate dehydrogenase E2 component (dihydrolipoamide acetyltransferase)